MKLDEVSKELIKTFNFDEILSPDLTDEEKIIYYQELLNKAKEDNKIDLEKDLVDILNDLLGGETDE